jgi:hypothetical protein
VNGGGDLAEAMLAMSAKFDALVGALTGISTATTGARGGGQGGIGLANEAGLEDASAEATTALMESHSRLMRMERLLRGAGLASDEAQAPEYLPLLVAARRSALAQAGRLVSIREVDENDDEEIDRGIGAQGELPPGVPMWPPRVFLARERDYTKGWHKWLLKQGESHRSETDPRIAEGDMLSVVALWLDYSALTDCKK